MLKLISVIVWKDIIFNKHHSTGVGIACHYCTVTAKTVIAHWPVLTVPGVITLYCLKLLIFGYLYAVYELSDLPDNELFVTLTKFTNNSSLLSKILAGKLHKSMTIATMWAIQSVPHICWISSVS